MKIHNKLESYKSINNLKLNKFPENIFNSNQETEVLNFMATYPAKYYAIRDKSKSSGIFKLKVEAQNVLKEIKGYDLFSINVSSYNYMENQLLVGEIVVSGENISAIISKNNSYSVRDAIINPDYNFSTTIFNKKLLDKIPYFDKIYQYIIEKNLGNIIVEFAYFDIAVGINNEHMIIYELRTEY